MKTHIYISDHSLQVKDTTTTLLYAQLNDNETSNNNTIEINKSVLDDARYKNLVNELRCLVCQNQTIADSNASLAIDLREQVAEQIIEGKSNDEILSYMEDRYGEFVLYKPQISFENSLLWLGPFIILALAASIALSTIRKYSKKK